MKNHFFTFLLTVSLSFAACNKDEDIVIDNPEKPEHPADPEHPAKELNYSVLEYIPGPGQYINESQSGFGDIYTEEEAVKQAQKRLSESLYVSLGAWGGYIVVKFNESIKNSGEYDFAISGNSFDSSNEPGIVWVMKDENGNGIPDEEWYELKGSYFGEPGYERNYWVSYQRPQPGEATPWEDSNGETGIVNWMGSYHNQDYYYPNWVKEESYTLYGSRLPSQAFQDEITGIWKNDPFEWGYVDNFGEDYDSSSGRNFFRISDAITEENEAAGLDYINFIKVQTAINGNAGILGENSTEVTGFYNLHQ